jgi:hypothetical protein
MTVLDRKHRCMGTPGPCSPRKRRISHYALTAAIWTVAFTPLNATTAAQLLSDPKLTPKQFAAYFETFEYEFGSEVQSPSEFLSRRKGDCDDYAILADHVLKRNGYATRLIHVRVVGRIAHAVCYVTESGAYLDYNNRKYFLNLQRCGRTLRAIATKVADSLEANWTTASEFTYDYETAAKQFVVTVVKTDPPAMDQDTAARERQASSAIPSTGSRS